MKDSVSSGIPAELTAPSDEFVVSAALFDRIAERHALGSPLLLLVAEPGFGKTSIAMRLVQISLGSCPTAHGFTPGWIHAWHFCQARRYESLNPRAVLERLASQLCKTVPGYAEQIAHGDDISVTVTQSISGDVHGSSITGIGSLVLPATDLRRLLHDYFRKPLAHLDRTVTILIDAIDECDEQNDAASSLAWLLSTIQNDPIPQLRLIATTRTGATARRFTDGHMALAEIPSSHTGDVRHYALRRLRETGVPDSELLANRISDAANGNFLYAVCAVGQCISEPAHRLGSLPSGLAELYREFLSRRIAADADRWRGTVRPILGLLVQSRGEGFTRRQLTTISGLAPSAVDEALDLCSPYLSGEGDGPFLPHHEALRNYLRTSPEHRIYPLEATRRIVNALTAGRMEPHAIAHLLGYLADYRQAAEHEEIDDVVQVTEKTVTDPTFLRARLAASGVDSLSAEVGALRKIFKESLLLETIHGALTQQAHNLRSRLARRRPGLTLTQLQYGCANFGVPDLITGCPAEDEPTLRAEWSAPREGTWLLAHTLAQPGTGFGELALSPDEKLVAVNRFKGVDLCDTVTGALIQSFSSSDHRVWGIGFSEDGRRVLAMLEGRNVVAWDINTREQVLATPEDLLALPWKVPPAIPFYIDAQKDSDDGPIAAITPDGRYAVVLCKERKTGFIAVWDLRRREIIGTFFADAVTALAITADARLVIVGEITRGVYAIAPPPGIGRTTRQGHRWPVEAIALSGDRAVSVGRDGTTIVWAVSSGHPELILPGPHADSVGLTPDGACHVVARNHDLDIFELGLRLVVRRLMVEGVPADEQWESRDGARESELPPIGFDPPYPERRPVRFYVDADRHWSTIAMDVSPDGRFAVTGTTHGVLRVWDLDTGDLHREFTRDGCFIPAVKFAAEGKTVVTVSRTGGLYLPDLVSVDRWSISSGDRIERLWPPASGAFHEIPCGEAAAISRDGRFLAMEGENGMVVVHDLLIRHEVGRLTVHGRLLKLAIDGTRVLVGTDRGEVTLIRFSPDGPENGARR
ncbi:WD40 repeat domain-containing protein [Actinocorallia sp. API 0066]|uniref:WD40 repeat domain-containing protein n=1 Tax=Actinocorallia sp. API 0066 TaxID=2896846 RepID=UPI001E4F5748|nr:WD40 repeat domain-containing protein [Actinocorallia sp. API 0066]MCD0447763.1 WD40 repeat domain-containing protein [Actinocorallia sp. API 0066]